MKSLPSLIKQDQQHTYVEHNGYRINFMPFDALYLITISSKSSNILEDIKIVRTLQGVVASVLQGEATEEGVCEQAIDLIMAIQDVISLGLRNICPQNQIMDALAMDSKNEREANEKKAKMVKNAKNEVNSYAKNSKKNGIPTYESYGATGSSSTNVPSISKGAEIGTSSSVSDIKGPPRLGLGVEKSAFNLRMVEDNSIGTKKSKIGGGKKVMTLGKKKKNKDSKKTSKQKKQELLDLQGDEDENSGAVFNPLDSAVEIVLKERISAILDKDGAEQSFGVKGELLVTVKDPAHPRVAIKIDSSSIPKGVKQRVLPIFNKKTWLQEGVLLPKNEKVVLEANKSFPAVKYTISSKKGKPMSPVVFSIWISDTQMMITAEFVAQQSWTESIDGLKVSWASPSGQPEVEDQENSSFSYDEDKDLCTWTIPQLDDEDLAEASLTLDFQGDSLNEEEMFPIEVNYDIVKPFANFDVQGVMSLDNSEDLKYEIKMDLATEDYKVEIV